MKPSTPQSRSGNPASQASAGKRPSRNRKDKEPMIVERKRGHWSESASRVLRERYLWRKDGKPLEDEDGSDVLGGEGVELSLGVCRQDQDVATESCAREQEAIELAGLLELIESPQGGEDALPWSAVFPAVLDDLEVGAWAGLLGAEEHGALVVETP